MGREAACTARYRTKTSAGRALLESDVLQFRGVFSLSIPFKAVSKVTVRGGTLAVTFDGHTASFVLGEAASTWARNIQHPPSRLDKIGVKPDWRVSIVGAADAGFVRELEAAVSKLSVGRVLKNSDAIFFGVTRGADLARIAALRMALKPNGALWTIREKGRSDLSERAVMAAGRAAGLVDVKVVRFSATHTAEKFVIPIAKRSGTSQAYGSPR